MATDATGSPTPLGIPKFNTSADAPSGLGFNAAMDSIDALVTARVTKPAGITTGEVPVWNGTTWVRSSAITVAGLFPGTEMGRTELASIGSTAVTSTGVGDILITLPAFTADGTSAYEVELNFGGILASATGFVRFVVTEAGSALSGYRNQPVSATVAAATHRFKLTSTLSAGSHTLRVNWKGDGATATYNINNTAPGDYMPIIARVVKV